MLQVIIYITAKPDNCIAGFEWHINVTSWSSMSHKHNDLYKKQHTQTQIEGGVRTLNKAILTDLNFFA